MALDCATLLAAIRTAALSCGLALPLHAQTWRETAAHLGGSARVLLVGTRPEDADNALIALLSRGLHVETGYLSLTRGEAGVNVAGSEGGAPLAVVRTAELLAERERDGAHQYFTRAFDFGAVEADSVVAAAWPRDSVLTDMVAVIRAFRPQVVIALTSVTGERDATRRYTAQLVADAFAVAADTVAMPPYRTGQLGAWRVARLYTLTDSIVDGARTLAIDVGVFDADAQRSYAEIGAETRRLQRTQPLRAAPTPGPLVRRLQRVDRADDDLASLFAASDTAVTRFEDVVPAAARADFDTLRLMLGDARRGASTERSDSSAARLARIIARTQMVGRTLECRAMSPASWCMGARGDLAVSLNRIREQATRAMLAAAGLVIDGVAARELVAPGDTVALTITVRNGGLAPVTLRGVLPFQQGGSAVGDVQKPLVLPPDSVAQLPGALVSRTISRHWWQMFGLVNGTQLHTVRDPTLSQTTRGGDRITTSGITAQVTIGGVELPVTVGPIVARAPTALRGDMRHPVIGVSETSLLFERSAEYERAGAPVNRLFRVFVSSARASTDTVQVSLSLPTGLRADSASRTVVLPPFGMRNLFFGLRGTLPPGPQVITASVRSLRALPAQAIGADQSAAMRLITSGTVINDYPHIPSQHFVRFARDRVESVTLRVPPRLRIGYIRGTEDVRMALVQLRLDVTPIDLGLLPAYDLTGITSLLIGTGALRSETALASVPAVQAFLARGGTVVVLGGGGEIARSGLYPYPIGTVLAAGRAANDSLDVRVTEAASPLLTWPNAITMRDYAAWNGDRTCSRATLVDPRYRTPVGVVDGSGKDVTPAIIAARVGKGTLVHTTLCFGPELEGARSGAARLLVNLLSAGVQRP
jgi:LmbE family N-acetylglucosaminyl deacetylase